MKVFLVRPNSKLRATTLPIGMGYVAEASRKAGHQVDFLDARLKRMPPEKVVEIVSKSRPDVVGLSAIHFEKRDSARLAQMLKASLPDSRVVLGGPLVSTSGEELVKSGVADGAFMGEGEESFTAYLDVLSKGGDLGSVPGLIHLRGGEVVMNPLPELIRDLDSRLPAWDLINPEQYFSSFGRSTLNMLQRSPRSVSIFTSRGCPFGCIYCHNIFGRKFRSRPPEAVLEEIRMLITDYGIKELEIVDDAFNVNLDRAKTIAEMIIREELNLHISFSNGLRADRMDEELIELLRRAGTYRINYAIETASPRLQKLIHKNLDLDKTMNVIEHTAGQDIFMLGYFMLGFPTETEEEMRMTMDYAMKSKLNAAGIFYVNPFPGTELTELYPLPEDKKKAQDGMDYTDLKLNLSEVSDETLRATVKTFYRRFHFQPGRMWRTFKVVPKNFRTAKSVAIVAVLSVADLPNF